MRAAVLDRYGPPSVVRVQEVADPQPADGEVVLDVAAVAVTAADARMRGANFPRGFGPFARLGIGVLRPRKRVLGASCSGVVRAVGAGVSGLAVGDEVCGQLDAGMGAHAEQVLARATSLVPKPAEVSHEDAAGLLFGGTTALGYLRDKGQVQPGHRVLVVGASGAVGTMAVQIAQILGARVTGVCSTPNVEVVQRLGADEVIDYRKTPPEHLTGSYDLVIDTVGALSIATGRRLLSDTGVLQLVAADLWQMLAARGRVQAGMVTGKPDDVRQLLQWAAAGDLVSVTDRVLPLDQIVQAHEVVDSGRKVGNIIITP
ncbi:NAD(P)-dependent alcohol dehydrogenase [Ornithinimicrobium faecis]|uniref:NAD(P)-dependent alcohol dehydrogenase n=1 Tax=Ornithinimicrobium faecis TaxID=2934158 RepID=UPI00211888EC|nr:NAD(P)-dependent alcohol dehydrogenase [Ornithinimicrobium sp. HY1745]